ncbi:hypothetical protein SDJN03_16634, partial [Cucurbita argyrosperma subsp. sororia]
MEDFKSNSYVDGRMQIENYYGNESRGGPNGSGGMAQEREIDEWILVEELEFQPDPEMQRKRRVASYKVLYCGRQSQRVF